MKKKFYPILSFAFLLFYTSISNAQTTPALSPEIDTKEGAKKLVDNGFFTYEVTGNEVIDLKNYGIAKEKFIEKFPEKYKEMIAASKPSAKHLIDKKEFDKMPEKKRNEILAHPERYEIVAEPKQ